MASFLSGFAETQPRGVFANLLAKQRKPVRDFFAPRYNELYDEYLGLLAAQAQSGRLPAGSFSDFLGGQNLRNRMMSYSPQQRGQFDRRLRPSTRSLHFI